MNDNFIIDPINRIMANFILKHIFSGSVPSEFQFNFGTRVDSVRIYDNERDAIKNIYNDSFIAIILTYPSKSERDNATGWIRTVGDINCQKAGMKKEYHMDVLIGKYSGFLSSSYFKVLKQGISEPIMFQNEIEFPSRPKEKCNIKNTSDLNFNILVSKYSKNITVPDLDNVRIVIRSYYKKCGNTNASATQKKEISMTQYIPPRPTENTHKTKKIKCFDKEENSKNSIISYSRANKKEPIPTTSSPQTTSQSRILNTNSNSNSVFHQSIEIDSIQSSSSSPIIRTSQTNTSTALPPFQFNYNPNNYPSPKIQTRLTNYSAKRCQIFETDEFSFLVSSLMESNLKSTHQEDIDRVYSHFKKHSPKTKQHKIGVMDPRPINRFGFNRESQSTNQPRPINEFGLNRDSHSTNQPRPINDFGLNRESQSTNQTRPINDFGLNRQSQSTNQTRPINEFGLNRESQSTNQPRPINEFGLNRQSQSTNQTRPINEFGLNRESQPKIEVLEPRPINDFGLNRDSQSTKQCNKERISFKQRIQNLKMLTAELEGYEYSPVRESQSSNQNNQKRNSKKETLKILKMHVDELEEDDH